MMKKRFLSGYGFRGGTPVSRRPFRRLTAALAALAALILTAALLPAPGRADAGNTEGSAPVSFHVTGDLFRCGDFLYRVLEDGTAELTEYVSRKGIEDVPDTIAGYPVTEIGPGAFSEQGFRSTTDDDCWYTLRRDILRIRLPEGIRRIGERAFEGCDSLQAVQLPESLRSIGPGAFSDCPVLMRVVLPESLEELGDYAFRGCRSLARLNLPASLRVIGANPFAECSRLTLLDAAESHPFLRYENGLLTDERNKRLIACTKAAWAETAQVPDGIEIIGDSAFSAAPFSAIRLPGSVTAIESLAFSGCERLTDMTLPESVRRIGDNPFRGCTALQSLSLSGGQEFFSLRDQALIDETENRLIACLPLPYPPAETENASAPDTEEPEPEEPFLCYGTVMKRIQETKRPNRLSIWDSKKEAADPACCQVPEGIRVIGGSAFYGSEFSRIYLPDSILEIGPEAFACSRLEVCSLPAKLKSIPDRLFYNCSGLKNVGVPEGVASVGAYAFSRTDIDSLVLPESAETVGAYAFSFCGCLEQITLSSRIRAIPRGAFLKCARLNELTIPEGVTEIGPEAFSYCGITRIDLPQGLTAIQDWCFYCSRVDQIILPKSVTWIGSYAFAGNGYDSPDLETIIFSQNLRYIADHAFVGAYYLSCAIKLPDSLAFIGDKAFASCSELRKVSLPRNFTEIRPGTFEHTGLTEINLPEGITRIGTNAFGSCGHLEWVNLPDGPVHLDGNPFPNCPALKHIWLSRSHPNLSLEDGFLIDIAEHRLICVLGNPASCVIPDGIEIIADSAFAASSYTSDPDLREVVFPKGLRRIGNDAFLDCGLQTIRLPDSLEEIGDCAFKNCPLEQIILPDSLKRIGDQAFFISKYNGRNLNSDYRTLSLPAGLRSIGKEAFSRVKLRQLILPDTLEKIGAGAFQNSEIAQVIIPAQAVEIDGNPFPGIRPQILLHDGHPTLELADGNLYAKAGRRLIVQCSCAPIREGTLEIGCSALNLLGDRIILPQSVELIDSLDRCAEYALWDSTLEHLKVYVVPGSAAEAYIETAKDNYNPAYEFDW